MIWVDDPVAEVARIAERGLDPVDVEKHDSVWKHVFRETREHARLGRLCGRIAKDRVEALADVPYEVLDTAELDERAAALELLAQQLIPARDGG